MVHVDEKWFYLIKEGSKYLLVHDEQPPKLSVHNKNSIGKVMFLCALARPRRLSDGTYWDGKLGIWPFGFEAPALRGSCNRPAGTMEWHNVSVDKKEHRRMMLNNVVTSIIEKWPTAQLYDDNFKITIQHDGAPSHFDGTKDEVWVEELTEMGLQDKIALVKQPANSPDTNINDLGFFASLQSRYYLENPKSCQDIIAMVKKTFEDYPSRLLNFIWLTYMSCLNEIIVHGGSNFYKIPHMNKHKLERENRLPHTLNVSERARDLVNLVNGEEIDEADDVMQVIGV